MLIVLAPAAVPAQSDGGSLPERPSEQAASGNDGAQVTPTGALYRSLAVPGWGQLTNGRRFKAALFAVAETVCIGGYVYYGTRVASGDYSGPDKDALKTDQNTFLLYFLLAKVLDIMDAYVDAQFSTYDVEDITPDGLVR